MLESNHWRWVVMAIVAVAAFTSGRLLPTPVPEEPSLERSIFRGARLTSPYLEANGAENADPVLVRARRQAAEYITVSQQADPTLRVSVYVRDLDTGPWVGINDRMLYVPSSLTKVAVLMRTLEREEEEPRTLQRTLVFPGSEAMMAVNSLEGAPDSVQLQPGTHYTVQELLRRMIVYSDNYAFQLIVDDGGGQGISRMLYDLSAEQALVDDVFYFDARTVATMLRSLYNSSFLGRRHSEYALELLGESRFTDGLRSTLPPDARVASKFGYHTSRTESGRHHELHECGIVYRPGSPYVICVMTATDQGEPQDLERVLGDLSRIFGVR
jgi:beta-lactamase class A